MIRVRAGAGLAEVQALAERARRLSGETLDAALEAGRAELERALLEELSVHTKVGPQLRGKVRVVVDGRRIVVHWPDWAVRALPLARDLSRTALDRAKAAMLEAMR